ncbi:alpha/beta family hydrolase [Gammaproteobacteria bacterium AB-CW1]|uniref:Alpha/beta family hydrolase n=1 Tax=Natronospira elongata TaxID=3110268 RepID=A0AAP6JEN7_9GAMM|nr:alpha/beta family hydrolase [Gammaproteobacteria bacterium AB-CW1]
MKSSRHQTLNITVGGVTLPALLERPDPALGLVLFVHGSGSSRFSPRNQQVARQLNEQALSTLLFDLLSEAEHEQDKLDGRFRFDIDLLSARLLAVLDWLRREPKLAALPVGLFGASTGAAAALIAAAERPRQVRAVVSRGGRVDLAGDALGRVRAPVLIIIGTLDREVYRLSRTASRQITTDYELRLIAGAAHLFEEPGKLEEVAQAAAAWFLRHLPEPEAEARPRPAVTGTGPRDTPQ